MKRIVLLWCGAAIVLALLFFRAEGEILFEGNEALEVFAGSAMDSWVYVQSTGSQDSDRKGKYISEDFIRYVEEITADEKEEGIFTGALSVGEISAADFERFIPNVLENYRIYAQGGDTGILDGRYYRIDLDGDGDEEIVVFSRDGGTMGFYGLDIYKRDVNGVYGLFYEAPHFDYFFNFGFISYDEDTYLITDYIDYDSKANRGLKVYAFREGAPVEGALIYRRPASHDGEERIKTDAGSREIASVITGRSHDWYMDLVYSYSEMAMVGKGEKINVAEDDIFNFKADLDNDGVDEKYRKERYYPSSRGQLAQLQFELEGYSLDTGRIKGLEQINFYENCKLPQLLWVERDSAGMNIICVLSTQDPFDTNKEDFQHDKYYVDGYRIEGDTCERVLLYSFVPQYEVITKIYKYDDDDEGQNP